MLKKYEFDQFFAMRGYWPVCDFSPDGKELAFITNISGQFNIWKQNIKSGCPEQLTFFEEESVTSMVWLNTDTIFFSAQNQGNENHQFYMLSLKERWPKKITTDSNAQHFFSPYALSPDRKKCAFYANIDNKENFDIYLYDFKKQKIESFFKQRKFLAVSHWSPDGRYLSIIDLKGMYDSDLYLLDIKTKKLNLITPHEGDVSYIPGPWNKQATGFYLISDQDHEFKSVGFYDVKKQKIQWIVEKRWDIEFIELTPDNKYLFYATNENGRSKLQTLDIGKKKVIPVSLPPGVLMESPYISKDSKQIILYFRKATHPTALYHLQIPGFQFKQIAGGFLGGIKERDLIVPRNISYKSHDGKQIPSLLSKPKNIKGKIPVVLSIHGGPHFQERPYYIAFDQFLVSRGVAVFAPNFRGSSGYGKTYTKLINRDWGGNELKDFEYAVQYLRSLPWIDAKRIAVWGGSFGGFATLSCMTRLSKYFCCGVDWFGPSNLITFVQTIPPSWKRFTFEEVGDPEKDRDFLIERSPISFIDNVKAPLQIIQGANDPRVVKSESDQMVEALRKKGLTVEYFVYNDEGHGFYKKRNSLDAYKKSAMFLLKHLGIKS
ncbi:MAG: hypothetical protein A2161_02465 [Candidatus Schekmanbacteria bacterium RBG_13_48_7]|uniref:Peptidase S9 prolyl oligopeptidase catalytic domain-containing protein n=1 Tax=Candidatus Schekmanbacteria bacterium RBG_13_48_7 TaxID=1817878 RepID=A0A1F7S024_9BACT|nr:MAG: hypothetical protein A2161_02465 [Candidatus Schekmanbacteria bacterium RBG_13_48_7]